MPAATVIPIAGLLGTVAAQLALALALTLAVEIAIGAAAFGLRTAPGLRALALANLLTNPALNFALLAVMGFSRSDTLSDPPVLAALVVLEAVAVLAEWRLLAWWLPGRKTQALRMSLVLNAASLGAGIGVAWLL